MRLAFDFKLIVLFTIVSIGTIALGFISFRDHELVKDTNRLVEHTQQVIYESEKVLSITKDFGSSSRGYLITKDSSFLLNFQIAQDSIGVAFKRLKELTRDSPKQQVRIDSLLPLVNKRLSSALMTVDMVNQNKEELAKEFISSMKGFQYMEGIRSLINEIQKEENELLLQRRQENEKRELASDRSFYFLTGAIILILIFTFWVIRNDFKFRKRVEEQLYQSSELYSQTLISLGDGVITTNANGIVNFLNKAAIELTGWKSEEAVGNHIEHIFKITHEKSGLPVVNPVMAAIQENSVKVLANHTILKRKDESILFIDDSGAPIHDRKGNVIGGVLVFRDVSAKKRAEDKLRSSEAKFRTYFENSMAGILITSPDGRIFNANPAACSILGRTEKQICALGREGIVDFTDPQLVDFFNDRSKTGKAKGEHTMIRNNGERFPVAVSSAVFDHVNGEQRTCLIFEDISSRKRSEELIRQMNKDLELRVEEKSKEVIEKEERYRYALDHMMEGVQIIDFNYRYVYLNEEALKQSMYTSQQLIGHTMMEMYPGFEKTAFFEILEQCMKFRTSTRLDNEFVYPDDSSRWYELSIQPVPEGLFILSTDITDRKHAEQRLNEQNAALKKTNTELDRFVYSVSHDLRAPLTSLLGLINITERDLNPLEKGQKDRLSMMKRSVTKLDGFIADILDYSRNARTQLSSQSINFDELIADVNENIRNMAEESECDLTFKIDQQHDFLSDKSRINMILNNLISNGIKYRDHKKSNPFVNVRVQVSDGHAVLEVEDNGIGIADSDKLRIFGMFERASSQSIGSGIGLYIVKETVEKMNGSVTVHSSSEGSKFVVKLPSMKLILSS